MKIAVLGNSPTHAGIGIAADLCLAGHDVRLARWAPGEIDFEAIRAAGGLAVAGDPAQLSGGRIGTAYPVLCEAMADAVAGAELVVVDFAPVDLEARIATLAPHLEDGQVLHISTNSYWSALRAWPILLRAGKSGVTVTEIISPTLTADYAGAKLTAKVLRHNLNVAALPASRTAQALARLRVLSRTLQGAVNVLETSFANLNFLGHPAITLLNLGHFDRAAEAGQNTNFWMEGATAGTALVEAAQHAERSRVAEALGVPARTFAAHLNATYGGTATGFRDAIRECSFYRALPPRSPEIWRRWLMADVPLAHVPFTEVARVAGVATPIHDAFVTLFSTLLGTDFRREGVTLEKLGLADCAKAQLLAYVRDGKR